MAASAAADREPPFTMTNHLMRSTKKAKIDDPSVIIEAVSDVVPIPIAMQEQQELHQAKELIPTATGMGLARKTVSYRDIYVGVNGGDALVSDGFLGHDDAESVEF